MPQVVMLREITFSSAQNVLAYRGMKDIISIDRVELAFACLATDNGAVNKNKLNVISCLPREVLLVR
jgi:hypothetical protein